MTSADGIQPLDVAVVDEDLLWRVELMNALRPLYADDYADVSTALERIHERDDTVVVLGSGVTPSIGAHVADLRARCPRVSVVALASANVPLKGLPGIDLVLPADATKDQLVAAVRVVAEKRRLARRERRLEADPPPSEGHLVVVTSAAGGDGTSTVALNVATTIAERGLGPVAVIETDPVLGDLPLMVGAQRHPTTSLQPKDLDAEIAIDRCTTAVAPGLDLIVTPSATDPLAQVDETWVPPVLAAAARHHSWVVVDVPPAPLLHAHVVDVADLVLLVTSTHLDSVKNTGVIASALRWTLAGREDVLALVVVERDDHGHEPSTIAATLRLPLLGTIPHDRAVEDALDRQRPVVALHPRAPASRALVELTDHVVARSHASRR